MSPVPEQFDSRLRRILDAVDSDPRCTAMDLAELVGLSASRLGHVVKRSTGMSLRSFVSARRLANAARLMEASPLSIKQVASRVGFAHTPSFTRAFKRHFGIGPRFWRSRFG